MNSSFTRRRPASAALLRACLLFLVLSAGAIVQAKPEFLDLFNATYKVDPSSALGKAECTICHTEPPKRNAYGRDLAQLIEASSGNKLTADMLKQVENLDSDGDGWSNIDEIKRGYLPGDPASHPPGKPPTPPAPPSAAASGSLIPTYAFHPVVVHFPIALFLFGMFLEFLGVRKKNAALGMAAFWNLLGGLISLGVVLPTGVAAWLLGKHELKGDMLIHLLLAVGSLFLMSITLVVRKELGNTSKFYWMILILAAIVVGLTGHFGGQMVYG